MKSKRTEATSSTSLSDLAIVGCGASTVYLLQNLTEHLAMFSRSIRTITIFEKGDRMGMGMPYNPATTDRFNICNISSLEIPKLPSTLVDWLSSLDENRLAEFDLTRDEISQSETYSRLAIGDYFQTQYHRVVDRLRDAGIEVIERSGCEVNDIAVDRSAGKVTIVQNCGQDRFDRAVIATGHAFTDPDQPESGFYSSPWPIQKLLPADGEHYNFTIGTLGASLSAFDVITSLAHRHGTFRDADTGLTFEPAAGTDDFKIVMHTSNGWLPHLQYEQEEPFREVYRHVDRDAMLGLRDDDGFLTLDRYFDEVCRAALQKAFAADNRDDLVRQLDDRSWKFEDLAERMESEHHYDDPFGGMRTEMPQAVRSVRGGKPIHWKETLDDLMYTLNFHAEWLPAEDHLRFRSVVMPFLMNVIAAMPLQSGRTLLALHDAGKLDLIPGRITEQNQVDGETIVTVEHQGQTTEHRYRMFVICGGQKPMSIDEFPFESLVKSGVVREARVRFHSSLSIDNLDESDMEHVIQSDGCPMYQPGGLDIDAYYRVIGKDGQPCMQLHNIAFPHTTGLRPYSYGLQACDQTASIVVMSWLEELRDGQSGDGSVDEASELYEVAID